jgi:hypothetical protein
MAKVQPVKNTKRQNRGLLNICVFGAVKYFHSANRLIRENPDNGIIA